MRLTRGRGGPRPGDLRAGSDASALASKGRRPGRPVARAPQYVLTQKRSESRGLRPGPLPEQLGVVADPHAREPQAALEADELYAAIAALPDDLRHLPVGVD